MLHLRKNLSECGQQDKQDIASCLLEKRIHVYLLKHIQQKQSEPSLENFK